MTPAYPVMTFVYFSGLVLDPGSSTDREQLLGSEKVPLRLPCICSLKLVDFDFILNVFFIILKIRCRIHAK